MNEYTCAGGAAGPARRGILQIHPSLRCNLSCAHCYSSSGPLVRTELDVEIVCRVVSEVASMGYDVISVSGGEPLMYPGIERVLAHAKSLGLFTTITTNGYFNQRARLERLRELVNLIAVSIDGPPGIHNEIRGSAKAFGNLELGLEALRASGIPFGFVHTLTGRNWEHLLWVAEFAAANGAGLLQIHPLESAGRAAVGMRCQSADDDVLAAVYVLAFALGARYQGVMRVQLDLLHRDLLREQPDLVHAEDIEMQSAGETPAHLLGLLVLEPDGEVVPVSYGFSRRYSLCNARERTLREAWPEYRERRLPAFRQLCRRVWEELTGVDGPLLSNWYETIVARSNRGAFILTEDVSRIAHTSCLAV